MEIKRFLIAGSQQRHNLYVVTDRKRFYEIEENSEKSIAKSGMKNPSRETLDLCVPVVLRFEKLPFERAQKTLEWVESKILEIDEEIQGAVNLTRQKLEMMVEH